MATIQDYDWADEVLHAAIGRDWYVPQFGNLQARRSTTATAAGRRS